MSHESLIKLMTGFEQKLQFGLYVGAHSGKQNWKTNKKLSFLLLQL